VGISGNLWGSMFRGITPINLDTKGRMAVPVRYRSDLLGNDSMVILTIDIQEACLLLYPLDEWRCIEKKLAELPSFNPAARRIQRLLIGHATELEIDNQGRILLPQILREYACLDKNIVFVGQGKKFEIWSEQHWLQAREIWLDAAKKDDDLPIELTTLAL
jgi:MraZ protein